MTGVRLQGLVSAVPGGRPAPRGEAGEEVLTDGREGLQGRPSGPRDARSAVCSIGIAPTRRRIVALVEEDADDVGAPLDCAVQPLDGVVEWSFPGSVDMPWVRIREDADVRAISGDPAGSSGSTGAPRRAAPALPEARVLEGSDLMVSGVRAHATPALISQRRVSAHRARGSRTMGRKTEVVKRLGLWKTMRTSNGRPCIGWPGATSIAH